jgi:hypothetical protein
MLDEILAIAADLTSVAAFVYVYLLHRQIRKNGRHDGT